MARLSQGLIQGLINPSFGPQLGQAGLFAGSMPGRMREAQAEQAKLEAQRRAQESIYQILNQNPLDPNTVQSAQAVGAQMGLDPNAVQTAIRQAQTGARENEHLSMAQADFKVRQTEAQVAAQEREEAQAQKRVAQMLEGAIASGSDVDRALLNVPLAHREFAREYTSKYQAFQDAAKERREKYQYNQQIPSDVLDSYRGIVGEEAIKTYTNNLRSLKPSVANKRLLDQVDYALKQKIEQEARDTDRALKPPTLQEQEAAKALLQRELGSSGMLMWKVEGDLSPEEIENFSYTVAAKRRTDPSWVPDKESLLDLWKKRNQSEGDETLVDDSWYNSLPKEVQSKVDQARAAGVPEEQIRNSDEVRNNLK